MQLIDRQLDFMAFAELLELWGKYLGARLIQPQLLRS